MNVIQANQSFLGLTQVVYCGFIALGFRTCL